MKYTVLLGSSGCRIDALCHVPVLFIRMWKTRRDETGTQKQQHSRFKMLTTFLAYLTLLAAAQVDFASAHEHTNFDQLALESDADWATKHMISEHHIMNFDPNAFFKLHDL